MSGSAFITVYDRTKEKMIADVFVETEEDLNNVYLILAAPDLYMTCKKLIEYLRKHTDMLGDFSPSELAILDEMATAVAKAEGEYGTLKEELEEQKYWRRKKISELLDRLKVK